MTALLIGGPRDGSVVAIGWDMPYLEVLVFPESVLASKVADDFFSASPVRVIYRRIEGTPTRRHE